VWCKEPEACRRSSRGQSGLPTRTMGSPTESLQVAAVAVFLDSLGLLSCGVSSTASSSLCLRFSTQTAANIPVREQPRGGALSEGFE
jgi:hypothetical protein